LRGYISKEIEAKRHLEGSQIKLHEDLQNIMTRDLQEVTIGELRALKERRLNDMQRRSRAKWL
jgi:seryl-tRNA(Sec) selenium transferase